MFLWQRNKIPTSNNDMGLPKIPQSYTGDFYDLHQEFSIASAKVIVPIILDYIRPNSLIDIGCGTGAWLSVWEKCGINDFVGVDGDHVNTDQLLIAKEKFYNANLNNGYQSLRKFDLVSCLEVAEHINPESAELFIDSLCNLGDFIVFSAAIPGQEGTLHINEQYPDYWLKQFQRNNFIPIDCIRRKVWMNQNVSMWYKQNILLYVKISSLNNYGNLNDEIDKTDTKFLNLVHPEYFNYKCNKVLHYEHILQKPSLLFNHLFKILKLKLKQSINSKFL